MRCVRCQVCSRLDSRSPAAKASWGTRHLQVDAGGKILRVSVKSAMCVVQHHDSWTTCLASLASADVVGQSLARRSKYAGNKLTTDLIPG